MTAARAVLVTGASSGIGRKLTERLAAQGCLVYAGARHEADLDALAQIQGVRPLCLDVTNMDDIASARQAVAGGGTGLYGLVNNAGVVTFGPVVNGNDNEFALTMAVNLFGPYHVTKAFVPLLIAAKGRIVMIGSVAGTVADPNVSAYSMSKHAIEAFTDSLAAELQPWGVGVSVVKPGSFSTEIGRNALKRLGPDPLVPDFSKFPDAEPVIEVIVRALFDPRPRRRYLVVPNRETAHMTVTRQIAQLVQLNEGHPHSFDRETLIEMIDEQLAAARWQVGTIAEPVVRSTAPG
jgi:NAD(P)-dependent dehydrogenase (short-subunit alcohol dehydrogenase family)